MIRLDLPRPAGGRRRLGELAQRMYYSGARLSRFEADWWTAQVSADQIVKSDAQRLRDRARDLVRNWPYAQRFTRLVARNVIGPEGIRLEPRIKTARDELDKATNARIREAWEEWGQAETCTVDGRLSWLEVQHLWASTEPQDGEFFLRLVRGYPNPWGFAVQVIDADLLDHYLNQSGGDGRNEIRMGVEMDQWGRPVAYHFLTHHRGEPNRWAREPERVRVPADQVVHLYGMNRPGQTRGVTWFHSVLLASRMLDGYTEAELVAARVGASACGAIMENPESYTPERDGVQESFEAQAGMFFRLGPGEKLETFDPNHPTTAFGDFYKNVLRQVCAGLDCSYASLASDLSDANYSSMRTGKLDEQDAWKLLQTRLAARMHRRVYREWLASAILGGRLELPSGDPTKFYAVAWRPRGFPWVDPEKDVRAAKEAIRMRLDSRTRIVAENGLEIGKVFEDLDAEQQLADEFEIELDPELEAKKAEPPPGGGEAQGVGDRWRAEWYGPGLVLAPDTTGNGNGKHG